MPDMSTSKPTGRWRDTLSSVTSAALLIAAITVTWATLAKPNVSRQAEPKVPSSVQSIQGIPIKGRPSAGLALIEYSDFECPFCRKFATEILPTLESKYISSGRLLVAFRHYPLERIHPLARGAAEAAACAFRQNKFWETHDQFFNKDASLDASGLLSASVRANVDPKEWQRCIAERPVKEVADDLASAAGLDIHGTPYFLLGISGRNGVKVTRAWSGARPVAFFSQAVEETLRVASK